MGDESENDLSVGQEEFLYKISDDFSRGYDAFCRLGGIFCFGREIGLEDKTLKEHIKCVAKICSKYNKDEQIQAVKTIIKQYINAINQTDSNLFKNRNVGRKDPVFELSRRVNEYVKKHNRTLEIRGLESVAHECFISAQELKRTPKIPGSNKTRYNLMLPDNSPENKPGRYSAMKKVLSGAG